MGPCVRVGTFHVITAFERKSTSVDIDKQNVKERCGEAL